MANFLHFFSGYFMSGYMSHIPFIPDEAPHFYFHMSYIVPPRSTMEKRINRAQLRSDQGLGSHCWSGCLPQADICRQCSAGTLRRDACQRWPNPSPRAQWQRPCRPICCWGRMQCPSPRTASSAGGLLIAMSAADGDKPAGALPPVETLAERAPAFRGERTQESPQPSKLVTADGSSHGGPSAFGIIARRAVTSPAGAFGLAGSPPSPPAQKGQGIPPLPRLLRLCAL